MSGGEILEIESADVIRLILQFLKEHNLTRTLHSLEEETRVALGCVDSLDQYRVAIEHGKWDQVLTTAGLIAYPEEALHLLYEQVVCELVEMRDRTLARKVLKETSALQSLKMIHPDRYRRLEQFCSRPSVDPRELYETSTKERRRHALAEVLLRDVKQVPPQRLLTLLGMAVKWQHHQGFLPIGAKFDLFKGMVATEVEVEDECVTKVGKTLKQGVECHVQSAVFSPDGVYFITGSVDGIIEVLDAMTGKLRRDLEYQSKDEMMVHDTAVMSLELSRDSEVLVSGSEDGQLKFWKLQNGQCVKKIDHAHGAAITSIQFSKDSSFVLTASLDNTARIHGIRTGRSMGVFRGHEAYVTTAIYNADGTNVITGSSDGKVKIWDSRSFECLHTLSPPAVLMSESAPLAGVNRVFLYKDKSDCFFVCTKSNTLHLLSMNGKVVKSFSSGKREGGDFVSATTSPSSNWLYCAAEDHSIYCFSNSVGRLEHIISDIHKADIFGVAHHPTLNRLASWGFDGVVAMYTT
eukprot:Lankesteria_metandrocarpae@DN5134_c0_g1_i1.p1